ncbi:MAG: serine/threonine protein kinase [Ruminococcus sp.]|nr:serine/threonine protein kinase [Ruminococcus sp.]
MMQTGDIVAEHYEVDRIIGRGGTSVVYRAYDLKAERAVRAVKEISKENIDVYEMAKRESKLIKELYERDKSNGFVPNIIEVYDRYSDRLYIIQDYLDGETLDDMLEVAPMPHDVFIDAAKQICAFMKFFHDTGRVHSDMKPENIMVLKPNPTLGNNKESKTRMKLKFIDFGTAIRNEGNSTEGYGYTPEYAAPEQYRNAGIDERTDIYNIGATFFHMIQGRKPLSVSMENRMRSSAERFRFDKNINAELKRIIQKCVADNPDERFKSCDALYKALNQIENHTHMRLLIILFSLMIVSFAGSAFSMYMSESLSTENNINTYSEKINEGDYAAAIQIDHTNRDDIYSKAIENFIKDEKLDAEEDNFITNEIKVLNSIQENDDNYGKCMYEIGNAYWLFYNPNDDEENNSMKLERLRIDASYEWFGKAITDTRFQEADPDSYKRAVVYYNIGKFYDEIDRKERDGTDDQSFYRNMWDNIKNMEEEIDSSNEVVSARVCQTLLSLISRYSMKFRQNGCSEEEQLEIIAHISRKVYQDDDITYQNNYSIQIASNFDIEAVRQKLRMAYAD